MERIGQPATSIPRSSGAEAVELGATMREMRLAHKRDLADVAAELRIRLAHLQAIEEGRFDDLPGATYALGFVRAYADYLGLDPDDAVRRFKEARGGPGAQSNLVLPSPVAEGRLPTGAILFVAAAIAVVTYGGWYYLSTHDKAPGDVIAEISERIDGVLRRAPEPMPSETASIEPPPVPTVAPPPAPRVATTPPQSPPPETARPPQAATPSVAREAAAAVASAPAAPPPAAAIPAPPAAPSAVRTAARPQTAATAPAARQEAAPTAEDEEDSPDDTPPPSTVPEREADTAAAVAPARTAARHIVIEAQGDSWVELRDGENRRVFSRVLRAGERYDVPNQPGLVMMTGNAGAIRVLVDGAAAPPLGPLNEVRRNIALDADRLLAGTAIQR